jgi:hypothetical protein
MYCIACRWNIIEKKKHNYFRIYFGNERIVRDCMQQKKSGEKVFLTLILYCIKFVSFKNVHCVYSRARARARTRINIMRLRNTVFFCISESTFMLYVEWFYFTVYWITFCTLCQNMLTGHTSDISDKFVLKVGYAPQLSTDLINMNANWAWAPDSLFKNPLKGQFHEIFDSWVFFRQTIPLSLLVHRLKPFWIRIRIREDIRLQKSTPR